MVLFPAWFYSPKREAISLWWAVLPCHIMASYPFSYNKALSSNPFLQWDFVLKSLSSQSALWRGGNTWRTSHLIICTKADKAWRFPRIMWCWFNTRPCRLETDSDKMSVWAALKIQQPMGWQPKSPGTFFISLSNNWSFWLQYDQEWYSNLVWMKNSSTQEPDLLQGPSENSASALSEFRSSQGLGLCFQVVPSYLDLSNYVIQKCLACPQAVLVHILQSWDISEAPSLKSTRTKSKWTHHFFG